MAEDYKNGIKVDRNVDIDLLKGPYSSVAEANAKVTPYLRSVSGTTGLKAGRTVIIDNGTTRAEYWWDGGTADSNLVAKTTGGGGSFDPNTSEIGTMSPLNAPVVSDMTINEAFQAVNDSLILDTVVPVNTPIATGMTPQQVAEALQGEVNELTIVSEPSKQSVYNRRFMSDFYSAIYDFVNGGITKTIGIAWYGNSVSSHISVQFINRLSRAFPMQYAAFPSAIGAPMNAVLTGPYKYKWNEAKATDQISVNGITTPVSITRSGSVATITFSSKNDFIIGQPITIAGADQSEYNGTFLITGTVTPLYAFTFNVAGSPATPATGTITSYGGQFDFTYLPSASHTELMNGAVLTLDSTTTPYSNIVSFFATGPGMGSVQIELLNYNTNAVISTTNIDLSGASLGAIKDLKTGLSNTIAYKLRMTATGKVVFLQSYFYENGLLAVNFGLGGCTFTQNNASNNAIFTYIANELNVRLLFVQAKEENITVSLPNVCTKINLLTTTTKFLINSLPDNKPGDDAVITAEGILYKNAAIANKYCYFDGFAVFGSYAELLRLGWQGDGVHPNVMANRYCANMILADMQAFEFEFGGYLIKNIDQRSMNINAYSILRKLSIITNNSNRYVDVIKAFGSTLPDAISITNIRTLWLGPDTDPNSCFIAPRTASSIQIQKRDASPAILYCGGIQAVGNNVSSVEYRLGVGGGVGNSISPSRSIQAHFYDTGSINPSQAFRKSRYTGGTPAATFGVGSDTILHNAAKSPIICEQDDITWEVATVGSEASKRTFWLMFAGVLRKSIEFLSNGGISLLIAGARLTYKTGTNQSVGSATLVAGVGTVANTSVTANTKVLTQLFTPGGTMGLRYKYSVNAGVGFTITAVDATGTTVTTDTSILDYYLTELV